MLHRYSEVIDLVYQQNAFHFEDPWSLVSFNQSLPLHRLDLIQKLEMFCDKTFTRRPYLYDSHHSIRCALSEMQGLKQLRMVVNRIDNRNIINVGLGHCFLGHVQSQRQDLDFLLYCHIYIRDIDSTSTHDWVSAFESLKLI